ncbi:ABC transporter permease [Hymenobacter properus]|uniref:ABC transporter permease n=1 Tax=Hymenobacter properus TaxID=2791026 RepID=A0A931BH73_9BACT|nr:ABC transporter permease [Hymenobacter properus]MBF9141232.1 ABC transporter permease [Hymenobacter properus]MBR7720041.1 ABC transporter permease [Microvirga sp. SRT04]
MNPSVRPSSLPALPPVPGVFVQFGRSLAADALKLRRTAALWLTLASGVLPVLLNFCILYFKGHLMLKPGADGWIKYTSMSWQTAAVLLPLFVVLLTSLVVGVENKAEGWKHLFALPVGRLPVWLSKLLIILGLNALAQLLFVALLLAGGYLLQALRPELHLQQFAPPLRVLGLLLGRTYLATLGIVGVQYVLSKWQQGFVLPVAVGMAGWVAGLTLLRWEHVGWIPYAGPMLTLLSTPFKPVPGMALPTIAPHEWYQLLWFGVSAGLGYVTLRWRNLA